MKNFKRAIALTMGTMMMATMAVPAMASDPSPTDPAATSDGVGNILAHTVETVVVPTSLKIAINPGGRKVTTGYVKAASFAAGTLYFSYNSTDKKYEKANPQPTSETFSNDTYYTAVTSDKQVVSLNYGMANKSTADKTVKVSFSAKYSATENKEAITFVDSKAKTEKKTDQNEDGAARGELKMYLAVASASALPTAKTYKKTADTAVETGKDYYEKTASGYTKKDSPEVADLATLYETTDEIGTMITSDELADVTMTMDAENNSVFAVASDENDATVQAGTEIGYALGKANYDLKDGEVVDFSTTQAQFQEKLEMKSLGGVAGFTLTGYMNEDADWTKADTTAITIVPKYKVKDASGEEVLVDEDKAYNQIQLSSAPSIVGNSAFVNTGVAVDISISLGTGSLAATDVTAVKLVKDGQTKPLEKTKYWTVNAEKNIVTLTAELATTWKKSNYQPEKMLIEFNDGTSAEFTFTIQ